MGRNKKILATDVLEILSNDQTTKARIAEILEVTPQTVSSRLRELREDGELIIHNGNGLILLTKDMIENDEEMAQAFKIWIEWVLKIFRNLMICAKPAQPLLPALRRSLKESLDIEEKKLLSQSCIRVKALIDYVQVEEEDEKEK